MINLGAQIDAQTDQNSVPKQILIPKKSMTNIRTHDFRMWKTDKIRPILFWCFVDLEGRVRDSKR